MQKHNLKRTHPNKKGKLVGRGGTRGKTAGRGTKGQNARAGHKKRPEIRDFIKRIPKLRGRGKNLNTTIQNKPFVINLRDLNTAFKAGDVVTPQSIISKGLVSKIMGAYPEIKILGTGTLDKKLSFKNCKISESAKTIIEKAGGSIMA